MGYVIDVALVAIVLLCAWRGFRTGIINGVIWIAAIAVSVYGANLAANAYYAEFTDMLEPFAVGVVENTLRGDEEEPEDGTANSGEAGVPSAVSFVTVPNSTKDLSSYDASMLVLTKLGFIEGVASPIAEEISARHRSVDNDMINDLTDIICDRVAFVAIFGIAFALISIIFMVIGNILDFSFGIPGHENLNHVTGAALGIIRGLMIVMVLGCLGRYLGILIPKAAEEGNALWRHVVEVNRVAEILHL